MDVWIERAVVELAFFRYRKAFGLEDDVQRGEAVIDVLAGLPSSLITGRTVCAAAPALRARARNPPVNSVRDFMFVPIELEGLSLNGQGTCVGAGGQTRQWRQVDVEIHCIAIGAGFVIPQDSNRRYL